MPFGVRRLVGQQSTHLPDVAAIAQAWPTVLQEAEDLMSSGYTVRRVQVVLDHSDGTVAVVEGEHLED